MVLHVIIQRLVPLSLYHYNELKAKKLGKNGNEFNMYACKGN